MPRGLWPGWIQSAFQTLPDHTERQMARVEYFTQIGTGNYNEKTSRLYTDLSCMTSRVMRSGWKQHDVFQALDKGETVNRNQTSSCSTEMSAE